MLGDEDQAEVYFQEAIEVARRQQAKSWELRRRRAWRGSGRTRASGKKLDRYRQSYAWFTEGFDTPDLTEARALLEQLS